MIILRIELRDEWLDICDYCVGGDTECCTDIFEVFRNLKVDLNPNSLELDANRVNITMLGWAPVIYYISTQSTT